MSGARSPVNLETLANAPSPWLDATGPHADLVLSTRVRLARNLVDPKAG